MWPVTWDKSYLPVVIRKDCIYTWTTVDCQDNHRQDSESEMNIIVVFKPVMNIKQLFVAINSVNTLPWGHKWSTSLRNQWWQQAVKYPANLKMMDESKQYGTGVWIRCVTKLGLAMLLWHIHTSYWGCWNSTLGGSNVRVIHPMGELFYFMIRWPNLTEHIYSMDILSHSGHRNNLKSNLR